MTYKITDPTVINRLITQPFDNAQASGQFGDRSVQGGSGPEARVQPSASGFINKVKSLYDRDIRQRRAEEGITRGVKSFDKALDKLLGAMVRAHDRGDVGLTKVIHRLETLHDSAKSATGRGADYKELFKARLDLLVAGRADHEPEGLSKANLELMSSFNNKCEKLGISPYSGPKHLREAAHINAWHLKEMDKALGDETSKRRARSDYGLFP